MTQTANPLLAVLGMGPLTIGRIEPFGQNQIMHVDAVTFLKERLEGDDIAGTGGATHLQFIDRNSVRYSVYPTTAEEPYRSLDLWPLLEAYRVLQAVYPYEVYERGAVPKDGLADEVAGSARERAQQLAQDMERVGYLRHGLRVNAAGTVFDATTSRDEANVVFSDLRGRGVPEERVETLRGRFEVIAKAARSAREHLFDAVVLLRGLRVVNDAERAFELLASAADRERAARGELSARDMASLLSQADDIVGRMHAVERDRTAAAFGYRRTSSISASGRMLLEDSEPPEIQNLGDALTAGKESDGDIRVFDRAAAWRTLRAQGVPQDACDRAVSEQVRRLALLADAREAWRAHQNPEPHEESLEP